MAMNAKRTAIVSGAARGIGRSIATRLAQDSCFVACLDWDEAGVLQAADDLVSQGLDAKGFGVDVRDRHSIQRCLTELGRPVDILVNNAGIYCDAPFMEIDEVRFTEILAVNLVGLFILSQEAVRRMEDGGRIINIASRSYLGARNMSHYAASKGGVVSLTRSMAMELAERNIAVNAIAPGLIDTPILDGLPEERRQDLLKLQPTGRMGRPEDIANTVAFLVDDRTEFITGQVLIVDGGKSLGVSGAL
jgi:3-oxoacyl-[acyl-carrier protein] reductase